MKCHQCGKSVDKADKFCISCGTALRHNVDNATENITTVMPAEQAEQMMQKMKQLLRHLSTEEKIIGGSSLVAFIAYFLPWYAYVGLTENGFALSRFSSWLYLIPVLLVISIALVYFSQGARMHTKVFYSTIQAVIGMYVFTLIVTKLDVYKLFGTYLIVISSIVLTFYSIYFQKKVLDK
jgi:hypothetical protein